MTSDAILQRMGRALRSIGYRDEWLLSNYEYADVAGDSYAVRTVAMAAFAQMPPSYRNACIGVITANGVSGAAHVQQHRALGAPMVFEVSDTGIDRWKVTKSGEPEFRGRISHNEIDKAFSVHQNEWNPDRVLRAKAIGADPGTVQLDFIDLGLMPALEGMIYKKMDRLLKDTLHKVVKTYQRYNHAEPPSDYLFRLVFRFIAAKLFRDRKFSGGWDSDDPATILKAVEGHYNSDSQNVLPFLRYRREVAEIAWETISSAFHFQNLSVDDLAFIYENTFITDKTRKTLGIHSTPPRVAEYIVRKLPFEELPESDRHILEPCSGHGVFLIAAMRRLRELLPAGMSDARRHQYFVNRLVGIEMDAFSLEVCRLSLMLADYPNPNGWRLHNEDVYATTRLNDELKRADIVLCNPPFKDFRYDEREKYGDDLLIQKPAELLRRILDNPPLLLGFVLPLIFNTGNPYRDFHHRLSRSYGSIELVSLPEVFNYSDVPTVLLLASEQRNKNALTAVTCRTFNDQSIETFFREGREPVANTELRTVAEEKDSSFSLWIPRFSRVWRYLEGFPTLEQEVDIHQGIHWKGRKGKHKRGERRTDVISDNETPGFIKGVPRVEDHLTQYSLKGHQYLSLCPEHQKDNSYKYPWNKPKAVCNAFRLRRSPWRVGAVADPLGLAFSKQFFAFWPSGATSIYALAALLNSPVTNAWCFTRDLQIENRKQTLCALPIPPPEYLAPEQEIDTLSRELHRRIQKSDEILQAGDGAALKQLLLQIDAAILKAYDLPPVLERELLDTFQGVPRPVPFEFNGYYPQNFSAYLPLHELISEEFKDARVDLLLERLEPVYDSKISEMVAWLAGD